MLFGSLCAPRVLVVDVVERSRDGLCIYLVRVHVEDSSFFVINPNRDVCRQDEASKSVSWVKMTERSWASRVMLAPLVQEQSRSAASR